MVQLTVGALAIICFIAPAVHARPGFTEFALSDTTLNSAPSTDFSIAASRSAASPISISTLGREDRGVEFDGTGLPSGVYFNRVAVGRESVTRRVDLVH